MASHSEFGESTTATEVASTFSEHIKGKTSKQSARLSHVYFSPPESNNI